MVLQARRRCPGNNLGARWLPRGYAPRCSRWQRPGRPPWYWPQLCRCVLCVLLAWPICRHGTLRALLQHLCSFEEFKQTSHGYCDSFAAFHKLGHGPDWTATRLKKGQHMDRVLGRSHVKDNRRISHRWLWSYCTPNIPQNLLPFWAPFNLTTTSNLWAPSGNHHGACAALSCASRQAMTRSQIQQSTQISKYLRQYEQLLQPWRNTTSGMMPCPLSHSDWTQTWVPQLKSVRLSLPTDSAHAPPTQWDCQTKQDRQMNPQIKKQSSWPSSSPTATTPPQITWLQRRFSWDNSSRNSQCHLQWKLLIKRGWIPNARYYYYIRSATPYVTRR